MKVNSYFIYSVLLFFLNGSFYINGALASATDWRLKITYEKEDISVFYRTHESGNIEFRGQTRIKTSLSSLVACLRDVETMSEWVYNLESAKVLKKISEFEAYTYVINSAPFPFSKRDSIVHTVISQNPETLAVTIKGKGAPDYIPEKEGYVRLSMVDSYWKFTPLDDGVVEVTFQGFGEPGGAIPANVSQSGVFRWITEKLLWKLPMESLTKLKTHIQQPEYQNATLDFIKEAEDL